MTNWEAALICSLHLINTAYLCKPHVLSAEDGEKMWPCACLLVYLLFRINASMATFNTINTVPIMSVAKFVVSFPERVTFASVSTNRDIWRMVNDYLQLCLFFCQLGLIYRNLLPILEMRTENDVWNLSHVFVTSANPFYETISEFTSAWIERNFADVINSLIWIITNIPTISISVWCLISIHHSSFCTLIDHFCWCSIWMLLLVYCVGGFHQSKTWIPCYQITFLMVHSCGYDQM